MCPHKEVTCTHKEVTCTHKEVTCPQGNYGVFSVACRGGGAMAPGRILKVGTNFNVVCYGPRAPYAFFFCLSIFPPGGYANSGGGGRRCKHWPPGAGDPLHATGSVVCKHAWHQEQVIAGNVYRSWPPTEVSLPHTQLKDDGQHYSHYSKPVPLFLFREW